MTEHMTLADFNKQVITPMLLRGIEKGDYDNVLGDMLEEHAKGESDDVVKAMLKRAAIVVRKPSIFDFKRPSDARLRIKLPND
jgi:hypothetical protein